LQEPGVKVALQELLLKRQNNYLTCLRAAGTTETEAVIRALETTNVETVMARHFVFTSSHDVLVGSGVPNSPAEDYMVMCMFQWQNGTQIPVYPEAIMKEAGATYNYPPWQGPWSNNKTP